VDKTYSHYDDHANSRVDVKGDVPLLVKWLSERQVIRLLLSLAVLKSSSTLHARIFEHRERKCVVLHKGQSTLGVEAVIFQELLCFLLLELVEVAVVATLADGDELGSVLTSRVVNKNNEVE